METRRTAAVTGGLIVLGAGLIYFAHSQKPALPPPRSTPSATVPGLIKATPVPEPSQSAEEEPTAAPSPMETPGPAAPADPGTAPWEAKIDEALRTNGSDLQTAQMLIGLLPTFPEEGQIDAAEHISNLLTDDQYNLALPLLSNPKLPETVLGVFMTDLMNREDPVKLRTLLKVAQVPEHPFREEALADLQIYLDADYETNWQKWSSALETYLATHPPQE